MVPLGQLKISINSDSLSIKVCVCVYVARSCVQLFVTPWTVAHQFPLSIGFSRQEYLEWVAISCSRRSSQPRDRTHVSCVSCIGRWVLYHWCKLGSRGGVYIPSPWIRVGSVTAVTNRVGGARDTVDFWSRKSSDCSFHFLSCETLSEVPMLVWPHVGTPGDSPYWAQVTSYPCCYRQNILEFSQ